ncbi:SLAM family member 9-like [Lithobates pipiens]
MGGILRPLFVAFILLFHYIIEGGGGDYPQRVIGVIGESSDLVFLQNFTHRAKEIVFKFNRGSETFKIAEFKDKKLETVLLQFQNRLEILRDRMRLRIKNVSFNDSGMYIAKITLENNAEHTVSFNLSLYEPVPAPSIRIDDKNYTSDKCNFTLHCGVQENTTSLSYTWEYRHNSSDNFKLYNSTSATIQISLQPGSSDIEVLCTVRNPANQKNVSRTLKSCQRKVTESHHIRHHWFVVGAMLFFVGVAYIILCKTKQLKKSIEETDGVISLGKNYIDPSEEYQEFSSVHKEKEDEKMASDDGELPSTFPLF